MQQLTNNPHTHWGVIPGAGNKYFNWSKPMRQVAKKSAAELKSLSEELALEAQIASYRADIVEANVRKMKSQAEYTKLRAAIKR